MRIPTRSAALTALAALGLATASCSEKGALSPAGTAAPRPAVGGAALPPVRISELHYDNAGTDAGEAIEVSGPAGTDLTGWKLYLYNGNGGATYEPTRTLAGAIPATCGARGVVVESYPVNGIQNGDPDGIALVDAAGTVVEFLSYEGTITATSGPAAGMTSRDIGVREAGTEPLGQSLQRTGGDTWSGPTASTFGSCNDDQEPVPPAPVARVAVSPATATIVRGATQQFTATAYDADDEVVAGASLAWSSSAPTVATVDAAGLATGVQPGDALIIATAASGAADTVSLRVNEPGAPPVGPVRFSEIHYDNSGADVGEAIEVEGPAGTDLSGWSVVLYNLTGGASYSTRPLTGVIPATCGGRGVVVLEYPADAGIQNGPQDGFALVNASGQVVEFLSYEGVLTANDGPAAGMTSTDIGVDEDPAPGAGQSLQRDSLGAWRGPVAASFGACNPSDSTTPPSGRMLLFTGRTASEPALPVGFQDQLFATLRVGDTSVPTTITWSSETPGLAAIDQNGVMTALGAGTAVLRATAADGTTGTVSLPTRVAVAGTTAEYGNNTEFGVPADADASDDYVLANERFTSSYSRTRGTPNWVSYNLDASHFGAEDRCDCFTFDPRLPAEFPRYTTADYTGAGTFHGYGIDRGHLARSFDRTSGSLDNAETFYFTNIIPQAADNNQGPWAALESHLGDLARLENREVYVIAGVAGSRGTLKDEGKVVIPAHTWKVAVILPRNQGLASIDDAGDLEVVAVVMPNVAGIRNVAWETYKTTVDSVEALSGYDLLALLPDEIEAAVEGGPNAAPTIAALRLDPAAGPFRVSAKACGDRYTACVRFRVADPDGAGDGPFAVALDWGDGTPWTPNAVPADTPLVAPHDYAAPGVYAVRVTVTDRRGASATATLTLRVDP